MVKPYFNWLTRNWRRTALGLAIIFVSLGAGAVGNHYVHDKQQSNREAKYNLLSRRILIEKPNDILLNFHGLQRDYQDYLAQKGLGDKVSLYFEYLPTGSSIGINEDKESLGASLFKLPLVISLYKQAEEGKVSLDTTVSLKKEWLNSQYGDLYKKGEGYRLTYREAIAYALEKSDNTAALMIYDAVSKAQKTATPDLLEFVDANYATDPSQAVLIGPQSYSSILKCLYFSCYLSKDNSQAILSDLTKAVADNRLTLFTPDTVSVAHKIGTYQQQNQSDCGIFYVPQRNYALCIMVQQSDPEASQIIGDLSLMTYDYLMTDKSNQ